MNTGQDEHWMRRAIDLARNGAGWVAPNPMVGAVLVQGDRIIAEGWHKNVGGAHAEVECLRTFGETPIPVDATLYVNLEPCSHHGRTPPCIDLLIARGMKRVVVAHGDPNPEVNGKGFARARDAGMNVVTGVREEEARWLNRRFITFHEQHRPYVILKWARSTDGFMDDHGERARISSPDTDVLVHHWRSEEQAIMVGSRTVMNDDPLLSVRLVEGRQPLRVVIDRGAITPTRYGIFTNDNALLVTAARRDDVRVDQLVIGTTTDPIDAVLRELAQRAITSVLVEGGSELLSHFIASGNWDEARVITGSKSFGGGARSPAFTTAIARSIGSSNDRIDLFTKGKPPDPSYSW